MKSFRKLFKFSSFHRKLWISRKTTVFGKYDVVKLGKVSPRKTVPDHIQKPSYHLSGEPTAAPSKTEIKSKEQILKLTRSCKLAANILKNVGKFLKVGQTTDEIDTYVHKLIIQNGAYPSTLNYHNFPKSVCTSVNNVACHGIPDDRRLKNGDIINVDISVFLDGFHGDCSKTFLVGEVDQIGKDLVYANEGCVYEAISIVCRPDAKFWEIGEYIQGRAENLGYNVIPAFAGHGIGEYFHGPPDIYHIYNNYPGVMKPGMAFTIEPIFTCGSPEIEILEDDWTAVTVDESRTAQKEHTVLITSNGVEILTVPD